MNRRWILAGAAVFLLVVATWIGKTAGRPGVSFGGPPVANFQTEHFAVWLYTLRRDEANAYLQVLESNVERLEKLVGVTVKERLEVAIYEDKTYPAYGLDWEVGRYDGSQLKISIDPRKSGNTPATLPKVGLHEYTHFLVSERAGKAGKRAVPLWLNEGIAMYAADQEPGMLLARHLIPLADINPAKSQQPVNDYAESGLAVRYIVDKAGEDKLPLLIDAYASGASDALKKVCGFSETEVVAHLKETLPQ